jgi:serine/threonine-protein kinase
MDQEYRLAGYEVLNTLGFGARSRIYEVRAADGENYALKHIERCEAHDDRMIEQAVREHEVASHLDHAAIRKTYRAIRKRQLLRLRHFFLLMEMVRGHTLEQQKPRTLQETCVICGRICGALHHMHQRGYIHADLKPNNILVDRNNNVKLIDLGQSCPHGTTKPRIQGTPDYIAPEQVRREPITPRTDVFNLGATLYWLLTDQHVPTLLPKGKQTQIDKREQPHKAQSPAELNPEVPPALSNLCLSAVQSDPGQRPTGIPDVHNRLQIAAKQLKQQNRSASTA